MRGFHPLVLRNHRANGSPVHRLTGGPIPIAQVKNDLTRVVHLAHMPRYARSHVVKADGLVLTSHVVVTEYADRLDQLVPAATLDLLQQEAAAHDHLSVHRGRTFHGWRRLVLPGPERGVRLPIAGHPRERGMRLAWSSADLKPFLGNGGNRAQQREQRCDGPSHSRLRSVMVVARLSGITAELSAARSVARSWHLI